MRRGDKKTTRRRSIEEWDVWDGRDEWPTGLVAFRAHHFFATCGSGTMPFSFSAAATALMTCSTLSGFTEIESIPKSTSIWRTRDGRSGPGRTCRLWSVFLGVAMSSLTNRATAAFVHRTGMLVRLGVSVHAEHRAASGHLLPMEKPSNRFSELVGHDHVGGDLAHDVDFKSVFAAAQTVGGDAPPAPGPPPRPAGRRESSP